MSVRDMRYYNLKSLVLGSSQNNKTHTDDTYDYNQAFLDEQFELLGNIYEIKEEKIRGSKIYTSIRASVGVVENIKTKTIVDDVRTIMFQDSSHDIYIGKRYEFKDNIWLTTNVSSIDTIMNNSKVERCNNVLKWFDVDTSEIYEEPCILANKLTATDDEQQKHIQTLNGSLMLTMQYNEYSKKIKTNQRFVINGSAYETKLPYSLIRQKTNDPNSIGLITLELSLEGNNVSDDTVNNIAYKEEIVEDIVLNGNVVTPSVHDLSMYVPYNIQKYEIYNYINNVKQLDTFEINFYDALGSAYKVSELTGNSFTLECLYFSKVPLVVSYKNLVSGDIGEFIIILRGVQ